MNNSNPKPSFTQHPSAEPTRALVSKARSPPTGSKTRVTVTVTEYSQTAASKILLFEADPWRLDWSNIHPWNLSFCSCGLPPGKQTVCGPGRQS